MNSSWPSIAFAAITVYLFLLTLPALSTAYRLLAALRSRTVQWPGPIVHDPHPGTSRGRARLGLPEQRLFSTFASHVVTLLAALAFSILTYVGTLRSWVTPRPGREWQLLVLSFLPTIGAMIAARRARYHGNQIENLLSDLKRQVEPRQADGQSAEAQYAIEHPWIEPHSPPTDADRAFSLYRESLRYLQAGDQARALGPYQEAQRLDPTLHQRLREALTQMARTCRPEQAGAIWYWIGVHSEYLGDHRQAVEWYEKAALAFEPLGYEKRQGRAYCNLGNAQLRLGSHAAALSAFERAVALNPKDGLAWINIGMLTYMSSHPGEPEYDRALDAFARAIAADPQAYYALIESRIRSFSYTPREDMEEIARRARQLA